MLSKNLRGIFGLIALILFLCPAEDSIAQTVDRIVAVVNGEAVTLYELNQRVKPQINRMQARAQESLSEQKREKVRLEILNSIVDEILLNQEASRLDIKISDGEVRNYMDQLKREQDLNEQEFVQQLQKQGMSKSEYEKKIKDKIARHRLLGSMVRKKVVVTQSEIEEYYKEHKHEYQQDKAVNVCMLLVDNKEKAKSLRKEIADEELSFEEAARKYSIGPAAEQGGDLGVLKWKDLGAKWRDALEDLEPERMSSVFELQDNYAILYLKNRTEGKTKPLDQVRDEIHDLLYKPKLEKRFQEYMEQLRSKAVIDIRL